MQDSEERGTTQEGQGGSSEREVRDDGSTLPRAFLSPLLRHWTLILVMFISTLATVMAVLYLWPETYAAKAKILVKMGRENIATTVPAGPSQPQVVATLGLRKEDINSEIEILDNAVLIERIVKTLGTGFLFPEGDQPTSFPQRLKHTLKHAVGTIKDALYEVLYALDMTKRLSSYERAVMLVGAGLTAQQVSNSDVLEVEFRWGSPEIARHVLATLLDFYLEEHLKAHRPSAEYAFFDTQVALIGQRLKDSEDRLRKLKHEQGITSYENQRSLLLQKVIDFRATLRNTETDLAETASKVDELRRQMTSLMQLKTPGFSTVYKEAEKDLLVHEVKLRAVEARRAQEEQHVKSYLTEIERLNNHETEMRRLERQMRIDEENYQTYQKKMEEARISNVLDRERIVNVRIIEPANASPRPVKPKKMLTLGIAAALSLIVGISLAFLSENTGSPPETGAHEKRG